MAPSYPRVEIIIYTKHGRLVQEPRVITLDSAEINIDGSRISLKGEIGAAPTFFDIKESQR